MSLKDYDGLAKSIIAWSKRTEIGPDMISDIINMTEMKINASDLKLRSEECQRKVKINTNDRFLSYPDDYKSMRKVSTMINGREHIFKYKSIGMMSAIDSPGLSSFYTLSGVLEFERVPDQQYSINLSYHKKLVPLEISGPRSTNNILKQYPMIYLYGAVEEAFNSVLDEKRASGYRNKFYQLVQMANSLEDSGRFPPGAAMTPYGTIV